jgi:hypothetical protein
MRVGVNAAKLDLTQRRGAKIPRGFNQFCEATTSFSRPV